MQYQHYKLLYCVILSLKILWTSQISNPFIVCLTIAKTMRYVTTHAARQCPERGYIAAEHSVNCLTVVNRLRISTFYSVHSIFTDQLSIYRDAVLREFVSFQETVLYSTSLYSPCMSERLPECWDTMQLCCHPTSSRHISVRMNISCFRDSNTKTAASLSSIHYIDAVNEDWHFRPISSPIYN